MALPVYGVPVITQADARGRRGEPRLVLTDHYPDFLYKLNLQMKGGDNMVWTPERGATIVDKPFETLWEEYKAATCCAGNDRSCCK